MKVLAHIHAFPPCHNAGAEHMMVAILKDLQVKGHQVKVWVREEAWKFPDDYEGIPIVNARKRDCPFEPFHQWADVILTHLDCTGEVNNYGWPDLTHKAVWFCHNSHQYIDFVRRPGYYRVVYNSEWLSQKMQYPQASMILRPPVRYQDYEGPTTREYITLINVAEAKGGKLLIELAKRMPERKFLGILGAYGVQEKASLPNLSYIPNNPNIKETYAKTAILLMPSSYESWGRTAIEAYSSGIPVIAHPTPGLVESMGMGGMFAMRSSVDAWVEAIRSLDDPETYARAGAYGKARAMELDPTNELNELEKFLCLSKLEYYDKWQLQEAERLQPVA